MTQIAGSHSYLQPRFSGHIDVDAPRLTKAGVTPEMIQTLQAEADKFEPIAHVSGYITGDERFDMSTDDTTNYIVVNVTNDPSNKIAYDLEAGDTSVFCDHPAGASFMYGFVDKHFRKAKSHDSIKHLQKLFQEYTGAKPNA